MDWYEENAQEYFEQTVDVDLRKLYAPFLALLPEPARILDAGCGSGRDSLAFKEMGHEIVAFDASKKLAAVAARELGETVEVKRFQEIQYTSAFDGIWACASLLHVPLRELPEVLSNLEVALKQGGVLYMSFKKGDGERQHHGRTFTDFTEEALASLVTENTNLSIERLWVTQDARPSRQAELWVNILVKKVRIRHR